MIISMVAADLTKWVAYGPVTVKKIWGNNATAGDIWIQLHQEPVLSANDVPAVKPFLAQSNNAFVYDLGEGIALSELLVGLSSNETKYVAVAAGLDLSIECATEYSASDSLTVVGDLTTQQSNMNVWSEADAAALRLRLLRVDCVESSGANAGDQIIIYGDDNGGDAGSIFFSKELALNKTTTLFFGQNFAPYSKGSGANANTAYLGCTVGRSIGWSLPNNFGIGSHQMAIRAIYDVAQ